MGLGHFMGHVIRDLSSPQSQAGLHKGQRSHSGPGSGCEAAALTLGFQCGPSWRLETREGGGSGHKSHLDLRVGESRLPRGAQGATQHLTALLLQGLGPTRGSAVQPSPQSGRMPSKVVLVRLLFLPAPSGRC